MIRRLHDADMDSVISIWLRASIAAHAFVDSDYWKSQTEEMRTTYIPSAETFVCELELNVVGFYCLHDDTLAAIFVAPELQGQGIGASLLRHAIEQRSRLFLSVYKENEASTGFYLRHGFRIIEERIDQHTGCRGPRKNIRGEEKQPNYRR